MGGAEPVGPPGVGATHPLRTLCADPHLPHSVRSGALAPAEKRREPGQRQGPGFQGGSRQQETPRTPRWPLGSRTGISGRRCLESRSKAAPGAPASSLPIPRRSRQRAPSRRPPPRETRSPPPGSARPPAAPEPLHMAPGAESRGSRSSGLPGPAAARARRVLAPPLPLGPRPRRRAEPPGAATGSTPGRRRAGGVKAWRPPAGAT